MRSIKFITLFWIVACSADSDVSRVLIAGPERSVAIFPADLGPQLLGQCSRSTPDPESYWTPDNAVVESAEARLEQVSAIRPSITVPREYLRQYVGIVLEGRRLLYLNAAKPQHFRANPEDPATVCDGGDAFWGAVFDPETGRFSEVQANGHA